MLNEKEIASALAITTAALKDTVEERDGYIRWYQDEVKKNKALLATIDAQHAEIVRLNEELQTVRENTTCTDGLKAAEAEASNES